MTTQDIIIVSSIVNSILGFTFVQFAKKESVKLIKSLLYGLFSGFLGFFSAICFAGYDGNHNYVFMGEFLTQIYGNIFIQAVINIILLFFVAKFFLKFSMTRSLLVAMLVAFSIPAIYCFIPIMMFMRG